MASKRLIKELDAYQRDPSPALSRLEPRSDEDIFQLVAVLRGPEGTAYEGGRWTLAVTVPPTYPNAPPEIRFQTPCCHPNVNFRTGEICLDLLKSSGGGGGGGGGAAAGGGGGGGGAWTPAYGVVSACEAVQQLLGAGGEPDSPLNLDLARLMRDGDLVGAEALVRFYTRLLAVPRS